MPRARLSPRRCWRMRWRSRPSCSWRLARASQAVELIQAATDLVKKRGPPLLTAWLNATEAEAWSVAGADLECRQLLDDAAAAKTE